MSSLRCGRTRLAGQPIPSNTALALNGSTHASTPLSEAPSPFLAS